MFDPGIRWWIDIPSGSIRRYHPAPGRVTGDRLSEKIGCLGLDDAGGETEVFVGRPGEDGERVADKVAEVAHPHPSMRFNDGIVDHQGGLRLSSMVMDTALGIDAARWCLSDPSAGLRPTDLAGFIIPNGAAFSPDGRTFYASDTHRDRRAVFAFDHDPDDGVLSNRPLLATIPDGGGRPDGATLFVTSLCRGPSDLDNDPHAGRIVMVRPGCQGLPEPRFKRG